MKYRRIDELRQQYPVAAMRRVMDVSESGYHAWRKRPPSPRAQENARLEVEIKAAYERTRKTYGSERLQADRVGVAAKAAVHGIIGNTGCSRNVVGRRREAHESNLSQQFLLWLPVQRRCFTAAGVLEIHFPCTGPD